MCQAKLNSPDEREEMKELALSKARMSLRRGFQKRRPSASNAIFALGCPSLAALW